MRDVEKAMRGWTLWNYAQSSATAYDAMALKVISTTLDAACSRIEVREA